MNILFVNINRVYGGGEVYINNLINYFSNYEYNIYLVTPKVDKLIDKVNNICSDIIISNGNTIPSIKEIVKINKFIKKKKIDVVVFNGHDSVLFSPFLNVKRKIYINHSTFNKNNIIKKKMVNLIRKIIFSGINRIIVLSEFNKKQFLRNKLCRESKLNVIFNGVNTKEFNVSSMKDDDKITICEIGRLDRKKGQVDLVKAFSKSYSKFNIDTELVFIGEGDDEDYIRQEIKKSGLKNIKLLGFSSEISKILSDIDIFCLPSYTESFPLSILEAMASGKAIIATDVGGIKEMIINNKNGILIKPNDLEELSNKLIYLVNNIEKAKELGRQAKMTAEMKFELDISMKKTMDIIVK